MSQKRSLAAELADALRRSRAEWAQHLEAAKQIAEVFAGLGMSHLLEGQKSGSRRRRRLGVAAKTAPGAGHGRTSAKPLIARRPNRQAAKPANKVESPVATTEPHTVCVVEDAVHGISGDFQTEPTAPSAPDSAPAALDLGQLAAMTRAILQQTPVDVTMLRLLLEQQGKGYLAAGRSDKLVLAAARTVWGMETGESGAPAEPQLQALGPSAVVADGRVLYVGAKDESYYQAQVEARRRGFELYAKESVGKPGGPVVVEPVVIVNQVGLRQADVKQWLQRIRFTTLMRFKSKSHHTIVQTAERALKEHQKTREHQAK